MDDGQTGDIKRSALKFIAGGPDDPRRGQGLCLNCPGKIVHYQEATRIWVYDDGSSHTGHTIELLPETERKRTSETKDSSRDMSGFTPPTVTPIQGLSPVLGYITKQYQLTGIVGEERNIVHLFLRCISRHLKPDLRGHVIPQGETGSGKSTLVRAVLKPFCKDVESYTRITGPGIDRKEGSLDGKILFLEQLGRYQPSQLRVLMTEGELSILVAERDEDSKRFVSHVHRLKGMPVFITTLTGAEIDPQLLSRVSTIEIDQSESQTKRIVEKKLEQWSTVAKEPEYKILGPISWIDEKCA